MSSHRPRRRLVVAYDRRLKAHLSQLRPLHYAAGADPKNDLPGFVRAASAIRRAGARLVIVQDDVNALAIVDPYTGITRPLLLPAGPAGERVFDDLRGNKPLKLDLEACVRLPYGRLVAFGSGSSPLRERLVVLDLAREAVPRIVEAPPFYAALRAQAAARSAELNIEGAVVQSGYLRLLQRGHGKRRSALWNAVLDFALADFTGWLDGKREVPPLQRALEVDLGGVSGVPFGFTDGCVTVSGRLAFLACAEDSVDVRSDGPVLGCRFGWLGADGRHGTMTDVLGPDGHPTRLKLEGIETVEDNETLFQVVADMDRPDEPAVLGTLAVRSAR
jgi:hypothetical protein